MQLQQKLNQCPLHPRAPVGVKQKSAAGQFGAAREIHQLRDSRKVPTPDLGLEAELGLCGPQLRMTGLSSALLPMATDSCGRLGRRNICSLARLRRGGGLFVQFRDFVAQIPRLLFLLLRSGGFLLAPIKRRQFPWKHGCAAPSNASTSAQWHAPLFVMFQHLVSRASSPAPRVARRWRTLSVLVANQFDIQHRGIIGGGLRRAAGFKTLVLTLALNSSMDGQTSTINGHQAQNSPLGAFRRGQPGGPDSGDSSGVDSYFHRLPFFSTVISSDGRRKSANAVSTNNDALGAKALKGTVAFIG